MSFKRAKSSAFNGAYIAKWIRPLDFKFVLYKFDQLYLCFNSSQIRCVDISFVSNANKFDFCISYNEHEICLQKKYREQGSSFDGKP